MAGITKGQLLEAIKLIKEYHDAHGNLNGLFNSEGKINADFLPEDIIGSSAWEKVSDKPFEELSTQFLVTDEDKTLELNIDGVTLYVNAEGKLAAIGEKGADGYSSSITAYKSGRISTIITDDAEHGTNTVYVIDGKDGTNGVDGRDGIDGTNGKDGISPTLSISENGTWVINSIDTGVKAQGEKGDTGTFKIAEQYTTVADMVADTNNIEHSNIVIVTTGGRMFIKLDTYVDPDGIHDKWLELGSFQDLSVAKGDKGDKGDNGITPTIDPTTKHWMLGTTDTGIVAEGKNGINGKDGKQGDQGNPGQDGFSPLISLTKGDRKVTITVTDKNGTQSQDIFDGEHSYDDTGIKKDINDLFTAKNILVGDSTVIGSVDYKIAEALKGFSSIDLKVVTQLPATGKEGTFYFVPITNPEDDNLYTEYFYINGKFEPMGAKPVKIDLTGYAKLTDIPTKVSQLNNDSKYVTETDLSTKLDDYAKTTDLPAIGSSTELGLFKVDGKTIVADENGVISSKGGKTDFSNITGNIDDNQPLKEKFESVESKLDSVNYAQKTINTELLHGFWNLKSYTPVVNQIVPLVSNNYSNTNLEMVDGKIYLIGGKTYQINCDIAYANTANNNTANILYSLRDSNNTIITNFEPYREDNKYEYSYSFVCQYYAKENTEIFLKVDTIYISDIIYQPFSRLTVQEIGSNIVIDPIEHINKESGIEDTPVGHILAHMGNTAPKHYLKCDGSIYNITDYPYLAEFIKTEFGSYNYFGGDGTTTFAVPDLRGEFLRGTGKNSHEYGGNGADVGIHQDATKHINLKQESNNTLLMYSGPTMSTENEDSTYPRNSGGGYFKGTSYEYNNYTHYTSRPTNTSVLYCIKYEPTYYLSNKIDTVNIQGYENYSEDEIVIGRWINGKPLYRKVIITQSQGNVTAWNNLIANSFNAETIVNCYGTSINTSGVNCFPYTRIYGAYIQYYMVNMYLTANSKVIIEYTKTTDEPNSFKPDMLENITIPLNGSSSGENNEVFTEADINAMIEADKFCSSSGENNEVLTEADINAMIEADKF